MILRWFRVDDWRSHGLAAGVAASGVAASQIAPLSGIAAAFGAIGIGMNGIVTACIVPLLAMPWPKKSCVPPEPSCQAQRRRILFEG